MHRFCVHYAKKYVFVVCGYELMEAYVWCVLDQAEVGIKDLYWMKVYLKFCPMGLITRAPQNSPQGV